MWRRRVALQLARSGLTRPKTILSRYRSTSAENINIPVGKTLPRGRWQKKWYVRGVIIAAAILGTASYYYSVNPWISLPLKVDPVVALAHNWRKFTVREVEKISPDTVRIRVSLWERHKTLGLPVAGFVMVRNEYDQVENNKTVEHPYTPITGEGVDHFDLIVKKYDNGKLTPYLYSLKPGDSIEVKGPKIKLPYKPNMKKHFGMIAGGTGITPMYQLIQRILSNPDDHTQIDLIYSNKTKADILLKKELDALAAEHPDRLKIKYVITREGTKERITKDLTNRYLRTKSNAGADTMVLVCGPPAFYETISGGKREPGVGGFLKEMGYTEKQVFKV